MLFGQRQQRRHDVLVARDVGAYQQVQSTQFGALRPAVVVLLAMLASKGTSVLRSTYVIHRGYEDLAERLNLLGANIETFRDI